MPREPAPPAARQVRSLLALGAIGTHGDDDLIRQFLGRGPSAQDAFSALVDRHGPMVLATCRRGLGDGHAAEDAFQATFLVLARRASSISPRAPLAAWLHGVAVRVASEARRSAARRQRREERSMPPAIIEDSRREDIDTLAILDEELAMLPEHYRSALVLCELQGRSRRDAAAAVNIAEGTLSSRLARGRSLLKARLIRRGVAPSAAVAALSIADVTGSVPIALAAATVASAVDGIASAGVGLLVGRVLGMMWLSKLKPGIAGGIALAMAGMLTVGLRAAIRGADDPPKPVAAATTSKADLPPDPPQAVARGSVVDELGQPAVGVDVTVNTMQDTVERGRTDVRGEFVVELPGARVSWSTITAVEGDRLGFFSYGRLPIEIPVAPARVVLKPACPVEVRIVDSAGKAVTGARVEALRTSRVDLFSRRAAATATTDDRGVAGLLIAADASVDLIYAVKSGRGFDYLTFGDEGKGVAGKALSGYLALRFDAPRKATIRAIDTAGRPLPGVRCGANSLDIPGKRRKAGVFLMTGLDATTDADGFARFDWLPPTRSDIDFSIYLKDHKVPMSTTLKAGVAEATIPARLVRDGSIAGLAVAADGRPASGVDVRVRTGPLLDEEWSPWSARTAADGTYRVEVPGEGSYSVWVDHKGAVAPARAGVAVGEGQAVEGVDFRLGPGTLLRGVVRSGVDGKPASGVSITVVEGGQGPAELQPVRWLDRTDLPTRRGTTDARGRYEIRVIPGRYTLWRPLGMGVERIDLAGAAEVIRDFDLPSPEKKPFEGRVVLAGDRDRGVVGAEVSGVAEASDERGWSEFADAEGRFRTRRVLGKATLFAKTRDGKLVGIVEVGPGQTEATIEVGPAASVSGTVVDRAGRPVADQMLLCGRKVLRRWGLGVESSSEMQMLDLSFSPATMTDNEGRFTLAEMVVGETYSIEAVPGVDLGSKRQVGRDRQPMGLVILATPRPEAAGHRDLGPLKLGGD